MFQDLKSSFWWVFLAFRDIGFFWLLGKSSFFQNTQKNSVLPSQNVVLLINSKSFYELVPVKCPQYLICYGSSVWGFSRKDDFLPHASISNAHCSLQIKNWYKEVALYPMDLPWKKFWAQKNFKNYNFYFLNLSPCLLYFGAPPLLSLHEFASQIFRSWFLQL